MVKTIKAEYLDNVYLFSYTYKGYTFVQNQSIL